MSEHQRERNLLLAHRWNLGTEIGQLESDLAEARRHREFFGSQLRRGAETVTEFAEGLDTLDGLREKAEIEHLNSLLACEVSPAVRVGDVDCYGDGPLRPGFLIDTSRLVSEHRTQDGVRRFLTHLSEASRVLHHGAEIHMPLRVDEDYLWTLPPAPGSALDELTEWFLEVLHEDD